MRQRALTVVTIIVFCVVGVLSAIVEVLLVPLYLGGTIFPITLVAAIALNFALPRLVHAVTDRGTAIALPMICWVITLIVLGYANTGHGSVLVPGYGDGQYVGLGLFFLGSLAGFISVMRELTPARIAAERR